MKRLAQSKLWTGFINLFNKLTTPVGIGPESGLRYWQERVVLTILFTGLILGSFAYIPSVRLSIKEQLWGVAFFDTAIYAMAFVLLFFRRIPFAVRANALIFSSFVLGLVLLSIVGPGASGPVWLFAFPMLAGVVIGVRTSVYALILNLISLIIIGVLIHYDYPAWMNPVPHTLERWIVISLNFILLNGVVAMSLAMVLRGLQSSLDHEKSLRLSLEHEIDERIETEKSLKESEMRYKTIIHGAAEGIVIFDAQLLEIVFVNLAACRMLGYEKENLIGKHLKTIITDPDLYDSLPHRANFDFNDILRVNDYQIKCNDGSTIFTNLSNTKITVDNRDCIASFITDITEQKAREIEKQKLKEQLQKSQKMESIGTLAGGIAHDFNNILSSIIGFTELSLDETEKKSSLEDNLQEVYTAGNRAKELVKQILTFARQTDEEFKPVQVSLVAKEALTLLRASIPTPVEIKQNLNCKILVLADPTQIHQIFMNLCTNAAHAMEEDGGVLEVSLSDKTFEDVFTSGYITLKPGQYLKIMISDTGTGISKENIETIFEPYFTTKAIGEGTGLGLSVVQGIVKNCGGEIIVESKIGKGTVFTIYLPVTKKREKIESYAQKEFPKGAESILVVDDEVPIVKMISQTLQGLGYQVTSSAGSIEALGVFKANPNAFDLVITDMNMPRMTGEKLSCELMKVRHNIPVILCTGFSKGISEERAAKIGTKALLKKPVLKGILAETIRKVLDEAKDKTQG
ncbi:MAG: ATP-binding protein [Desulfobacteraceae bacterium]|nr:ATP-binding protein [Desulfobacteraceae bacterium]